jgi:glycosyltransferase involved in cell wall biosynthesis
MRLAYVCADPGVPVFGRKGCSIHVQEVLRALLRRGIDVELFAARFGERARRSLESLRVHALPSAAGGDAAARERLALAANRDLEGALEREGPFDVVYERQSLWSFAAMEYARDTGVPGLLEVNAPLIEEQERHRGLVDREGAQRAADRSFAAATTLIAVSDPLARHLESHPSARGRVRVVANGVDPERFRPGLRPAIPPVPGVFTVGFVGSMKPWHGLSVLVEAFSRLHATDPQTRLLLVGDGPERSAIEAGIHERDLTDAVIVTGAVDPEEVPRFLVSMDAAVAPHLPYETFYFSPLKVYEYMAAGLPVVASRLGQLVELSEEGRCALLCAPGDAGAFAEALGLLRKDPQLSRRLSRAAREKVLSESSWDRVVERLLEGTRTAPPALAGEAR